MATLVVTRHPGAVDWLREHRPALGADAEVVAHLTASRVAGLAAGDVVIGVLPLGLAAAICARGARVIALDLPSLPPEWRGRELTAAEMTAAGATLTEYSVSVVA